MHLCCSGLICQKAERTLSPGLVVITSSKSNALVLFSVDQPRAERTLSGLRAGHWRTCNNHALVLFCGDQPRAERT